MERVKNVKGNTLLKEIDSLIHRAEGIRIREDKKGFKKQVESLVKAHAPKGSTKKGKSEVSVSNMLDNMKKAYSKTKKNVKATTQRISDLNAKAQTGDLTQFDIIEMQFHALNDSNIDLESDVLAYSDLAYDIDMSIQFGEQHVKASDAERKARNKLASDKMIDVDSGERILDRPEDPDITHIEIQKATYGVVNNAISFLNNLAESFNTLVKKIAPDVEPLRRVPKMDMAYRRVRAAIKAELKAWVKAELPPNYMRDNYDKNGINVERFGANGEKVRIKLTKGELVQRVMELQNPETLESALEGDTNYTMAIVEELKAQLNNEDKKVIAKHRELYDKSYERLNAVYERMYNVSLSKTEFYTHIEREGMSGNSKEDIGLLEQAWQKDGNKIPGLLKERTASRLALKPKDIRDVFEAYLQDSEYFIAYAEGLRDIREVLGAKGVAESMIRRHGKKNWDHLNAHIDLMTERTANKLHWPIMDWLRKNAVISSLGLKGQVGAKQVTSAALMMDDVPTGVREKYMLDFAKNPLEAKRILDEHDTIRDRAEHYDPELDSISGKKTRTLYGEGHKARDIFMKGVSVGDISAIYFGGYVKYRYLTDNGISHQDALEIVAELAESSQQSTLQSNLSLAQKNNNPVVKMALMFTSSPIAMINHNMVTIHDYKAGKIPRELAAKKLAISWSFTSMAFEYLASGLDFPDDMEDVARYFKAGLLGPARGLPILGDSMDYLLSSMLNIGLEAIGADKLDTYEYSLNILAENKFGELVRTPVILWDALMELKDGEVTALEFADEMTSMVQWATSVPVETIFNMIEGGFDIMDGEVKQGLKREAGFGDSVAEHDEDDQETNAPIPVR